MSSVELFICPDRWTDHLPDTALLPLCYTCERGLSTSLGRPYWELWKAGANSPRLRCPTVGFCSSQTLKEGVLKERLLRQPQQTGSSNLCVCVLTYAESNAQPRDTCKHVGSRTYRDVQSQENAGDAGKFFGLRDLFFPLFSFFRRM